MGPRAGQDGCGKSRVHRDSIPGRPVPSESLYRLSYPGPLLFHLFKRKIFRMLFTAISIGCKVFDLHSHGTHIHTHMRSLKEISQKNLSVVVKDMCPDVLIECRLKPIFTMNSHRNSHTGDHCHYLQLMIASPCRHKC